MGFAILFSESNTFVKAEHKASGWSHNLSSERQKAHVADTLLLNIRVLFPFLNANEMVFLRWQTKDISTPLLLLKTLLKTKKQKNKLCL